MTSPKPTTNLHGPSGPRVSTIERRFVQTGFVDRTQVKKLRRVPLDYFLDHEARTVCQQLIENKPVMNGFTDDLGAPVPPLATTEMDAAIEVIADNYLMRQSVQYGKSLTQAAERSDLKTVRQLLKVRPTAHGAHDAPTAAQIVPSVIAMATSTVDVFPRVRGPHGRKITLAPGSVTVVAAGPAAGKTAFVEDLMLELAKDGVPVCDYSVELQPDIKAARYMQHLRGPSVSPENLFARTFDPVALAEAARELSALPLRIVCDKLTTQEICDSIRQQVEENGIKVVAIDFLQIIQDPAFPDNDYARITNAANELYRLAKETGVAMIWLAQLNREGRKAGVMPRKEDIEGSGRIEQLAWTVLILHPDSALPSPGMPRGFSVIFDKVRLSGPATFKAEFRGESLEFDVEKTKAKAKALTGSALI